MKFKIYSKDIHTDKTYVHVYDNQDQNINNYHTGIPLFLSQDPRFQHMLDGVNKHHSTNMFDNVRIQLGLQCNFNCRYCHQHLDRQLTSKKQSKSSANDIVKLLVDNGITSDSFTLWGGEPLVYWKSVQQLIPLLKRYYPYSVISLCTNGSLLTLEKAVFLSKYNVEIAISHDGYSFNTYRDDSDPLLNKETIKAIQYYHDSGNKITFNVVITPDNCDILKIREYINSKTSRAIPINIESIVRCDSETKNIIKQFNSQSVKTLYQSLFLINTNRTDQFERQFNEISRVVQWIIENRLMESSQYYCSSSSSRYLAVDMEGNVLTCHDANPITHKIGHVSDIKGINRLSKLTSSLSRPKCTKCPYVIVCRGGCPKTPNGLDHDIACQNLKIYYSIFFASVWYRMFNLLITDIQPM